MSEAEQITTLQKHISQLEAENKSLHETVAYLSHKLFGRSSEKTAALGIEGQLSYFDEAETLADPKSSQPDMKDVEGYRRKKHQGQREELLADIAHEKKLCTLAEEDRFCQKCSTDLVSVGEEFVRTEVEFIPSKVRVIDYYRETFECRKCRKDGEAYMEKSPMPYPVIQHSMASASTIAWVMHQKYVNAVPLYRQENEWKNLGVNLSRATMANWIMVSSRDWLMPIVDLLHKNLLKEKYLHADETPLQVMNEPGRKNTSDSYMWVYSTGKYSEHPIRIFEYRPGRSGDYPQEFLKGFNGYLHTDAYSGYKKVPQITRCLCWSHLRRDFVDCLPKDIKNPEATLPTIGIEYCNKIFDIEKRLEVLSAEGRKKQRLIQEKPVLDDFWSWVDETKTKVMPKSKLSKALNYALNQKEGLMNYLLDRNCSISNNLAENSIRPFTIGRKNWLFSASPKGAAASASVYTLVETAKANGLNPYKYLQFILSDIPGTAFLQYPEFLEEYLPWDPYIQKKCR